MLTYCYFLRLRQKFIKIGLLELKFLKKLYKTRNFSSVKLFQSYDQNRLPNLESFKPEKIRNFGIVAHVDHGKSTLADRLLKQTNVISVEERAQFLDKLQVERERGITVKAQTCTMLYKDHMINLIDCPGHVDFSFEVARSLTACDGILLLVAANQGVQAQTIANFWMAFENGQTIIPVINKIDMPDVNIDSVEKQIKNLFDFDAKDVVRISAKTGQNVDTILDLIIERIPYPKVTNLTGKFQGIIFDSWFDKYRGAIALIVVKQGLIKKNAYIHSLNNQKQYQVLEIGVMHPEMVQVQALYAGQVGYIVCNMKTVTEASIGEILYDATETELITPFRGFKQIKPTLYASLYPMDVSDYEDLKLSLERLCLSDPSVVVEKCTSHALGLGWRIGFLGMLHMEVFEQRLDQDYNANVIMTAPSVEYKARIIENENVRKKRYEGKAQIKITNSSQFPDPVSDVEQFFEPMILATIIVPNEYLQSVNELCMNTRGEPSGDVVSVDESRVMLKHRLPLADVMLEFFENLKRLTSGYVSFDYEEDDFRPIELVKISIQINNQIVDEFSTICPRTLAQQKTRQLVEKLSIEIPRQQYEVVIKAFLGTSSKPIAQKIIKAYKKDFTGLMKGNMAIDRLGKKINHQKKGKERMKSIGVLKIPKEAFMNVLKK